VPRTWADLTKAKTDLGYSPKVGFLEGLERQWAHMKARDPSLP
jgi:hypothetical protein